MRLVLGPYIPGHQTHRKGPTEKDLHLILKNIWCNSNSRSHEKAPLLNQKYRGKIRYPVVVDYKKKRFLREMPEMSIDSSTVTELQMITDLLLQYKRAQMALFFGLIANWHGTYRMWYSDVMVWHLSKVLFDWIRQTQLPVQYRTRHGTRDPTSTQLWSIMFYL